MSIAEEVVIIDDDRSVRTALANLTASAGLLARSYASVDNFLNEPERPTAGCFLLDVKLPGLDGLEFQAMMAGLGIRLPVILITGFGDIPMSVKGMRAGAVDFLTKPFRENEVLDAISRALDADRDRRAGEAERSDAVQRYKSLSKREGEVMALVTAGKMNKQAAGILGLSEITVKIHRGSLMRKMGVRTLADLVKLSHVIASAAPELVTNLDS
jgi:FixJ family two-component response regulator